jgi:hypothetical protein
MADDRSTTESPPRAQNPVQLSYATPSPKGAASDDFDKILEIGRRAVFALGAGLFAFGVGNGWMNVSKGDVGSFMGWGAGLMALTWPWRSMRQRQSEK